MFPESPCKHQLPDTAKQLSSWQADDVKAAFYSFHCICESLMTHLELSCKTKVHICNCFVRHCSAMSVGKKNAVRFENPTTGLLGMVHLHIYVLLILFIFFTVGWSCRLDLLVLKSLANMDELVVLDLLNCPVCLGKLDATAKVLPCQHTFCQPCLQRILKARKELRCPECRTPVYCSIEELPANLLLVRLLEGIQSGQGLVRKNSFQRVGGLFTHDSFRKGREQKTNHESQYRLFPKTRMPIEGVRY